MRRVLMVVVLAAVAIGGLGGRALAQEQAIDAAFSDTRLSGLGYPAFTVRVGEAGVEAPGTLPAGIYLVTLVVEGPNLGYVDFMLPPAELSPEEMRQQALEAAAADVVRPGWGFAGGSFVFEVGTPVSFLIELAPGEYQVAASYQPAEGEYELENEIMRLSPLTVTAPGGASASPIASPAASPVASPVTTPVASPAASPVAAPAGPPVADVVLAMTDAPAYVVTPDPIPAGPRIWQITNTGTELSHHVVMYRIPDGITAEEIVADFAALMSGTPPAGPPLIAQFIGVGYAALQSGGRTTWNEFDLSAGTYAVICFIIDPATGVPHLVDGQVTVFTVA